MDLNKKLSIQIKVVKRLSKDLKYYSDEFSQLHNNINDCEEDDIYDIKKKNELLQETYLVLNEIKIKKSLETDKLIELVNKYNKVDVDIKCMDEAKELLKHI